MGGGHIEDHKVFALLVDCQTDEAVGVVELVEGGLDVVVVVVVADVDVVDVGVVALGTELLEHDLVEPALRG